MRAILATVAYKLIYARKRFASVLQDRFGFESEHVEAYQGLGGVAPKVTVIGE